MAGYRDLSASAVANSQKKLILDFHRWQAESWSAHLLCGSTLLQPLLWNATFMTFMDVPSWWDLPSLPPGR
jgi:hypothetical protein